MTDLVRGYGLKLSIWSIKFGQDILVEDFEILVIHHIHLYCVYFVSVYQCVYIMRLYFVCQYVYSKFRSTRLRVISVRVGGAGGRGGDPPKF